MSDRQKMLAVDDEPRNLKIIGLGLGEEWAVRTAVNGEEALSVMASYVPDVVLLDIMMPGIDGYEVCSQIKKNEKYKFTKVILVSGKAMIEERLKGYSVGADDYLSKPFVPEELQAKIRVFMRLTNIERQLWELNASLEEKVKIRTERLLNAEAKLINSAKMSALGEMAGGIAHEVNTPLAAISMMSEQLLDMVQSNELDKEKAEKFLSNIGQVVIKISKIVQGLRMFSRDSTNDPFIEVSLNEIISSTLSLCDEKISHAGVKITIEQPDHPIAISCRPSQLSQVLLNLISNSFHSISGLVDKWIIVKVEDIGATVRLSVTDSGLGIPVESRDKIFQPFFTTKDVGQGTGLGLSISKGIIDSHNGSLRLDTSNKNTAFVMELPKLQSVKAA